MRYIIYPSCSGFTPWTSNVLHHPNWLGSGGKQHILKRLNETRLGFKWFKVTPWVWHGETPVRPKKKKTHTAPNTHLSKFLFFQSDKNLCSAPCFKISKRESIKNFSWKSCIYFVVLLKSWRFFNLRPNAEFMMDKMISPVPPPHFKRSIPFTISV